MLIGDVLVYFSYQVAKIPQIVQQQQTTVANIQQIVSSPQQVRLLTYHMTDHMNKGVISSVPTLYHRLPLLICLTFSGIGLY